MVEGGGGERRSCMFRNFILYKQYFAKLFLRDILWKCKEKENSPSNECFSRYSIRRKCILFHILIKQKIRGKKIKYVFMFAEITL